MAQVALITGAARRIGAACARLLHARGLNVIVHYHHSESDAWVLVDELNDLRAESAFALKADLLVASDVEQLATEASRCFGNIDVLINNASSFYPTPLGLVQEQDWDILLGSNLKAPFFLSQALAPMLRDQGGCIVNLVDIHAERGLPGHFVYSIAKAGLVAMTKCLAKELAPHVRVNAVAPGAILWPEVEISDTQKNDVLQKVPLARCGDVNDIAKAVAFLVSDAEYVTGQILAVDGGRLLFS